MLRAHTSHQLVIGVVLVALADCIARKGGVNPVWPEENCSKDETMLGGAQIPGSDRKGGSFRLRRWYVIVIIGSALFILLFPRLWSFAWHIRFGGSTNFRGLTIPVPTGWIAESKGDRLLLVEAPKLYLFQEVRGAVFYPTSRAQAGGAKSARDLLIEEQAIVSTLTHSGYAHTGTRNILIANADARCFEFSDKREVSERTILCTVPSKRIDIRFEGEEENVSRFYSLVEAIRPSSD